jgi:hypothetical protein
VSGQLDTLATLPPGKEPPGTHRIGSWVGPKAGLDDVEKRKILPLPELELGPLVRPAGSQSLYRLKFSYLYLGFQNNLSSSGIFLQKLRVEFIYIDMTKHHDVSERRNRMLMVKKSWSCQGIA